MNFIVIHDPKGEFWEGALIEGQHAEFLRTRGVSYLPVDSRLFMKNAIAGYFKRAWGAGWKLPPVVPGRVAPAIFYAVVDMTHVHWCARLVRDGEESPVGTLRLVNDSGQFQANTGNLSSLDHNLVRLETLGEPDEEGGWNIYGRARISTLSEGYCGIALWGAGAGVKVAWVALTQTAQ